MADKVAVRIDRIFNCGGKNIFRGQPVIHREYLRPGSPGNPYTQTQMVFCRAKSETTSMEKKNCVTCHRFRNVDPVAIDALREFHAFGNHVFSMVVLHILVECRIILPYQGDWLLLVGSVGFDEGKKVYR